MKEREIRASFKGLIPFIVFIFIYLGTGIFLNMKGVNLAFYQLPGPVAAFAAIIIGFIIFKGTIQEKFETFLEGCGHQDIITMCVIYLLAGAFAVVSKAMGGVEATVNLGITYIPPHFIAVGLFIIGAFISTATGTSVGAIVALGPIAVGLGEKSGVPMALILAAVMGGAMFGDNLSVISDTTIAATKTQGVEMKDKFRINLYIAAPAAILTIILLVIFGRPEVAPEVAVQSFDLVKVLPYIFVLVMALIGVNVFVVLTAGVLLSGVIGFAYGDFTLLSFGQEIYNGFTNMTEIFILSMLTGGMAQMVTKEGGIQWVIEAVQKMIIGKKSTKLGIGLLVGLTDIAVANNTVAIIINGSIAKQLSEKYEVDLRESAAFLDIFSCIMQGIIPYGAQMLILLGFAKDAVSPTELIPLLWYQILLGVFSVIYIIFPAISEKVLKTLDK
ncbi:MAG: Na+/H+ antiporter NhaC family protein [Fusobacterium gastrosuis]|uniref:Na+/H+ antiporter NhaC family protein n=1 Tax=Fusobacterium gastrosuis TaxID=1755100 RepID=UPI001F4F5E22|nr:Na+/H+ antiporter NhaC family protein [Fusobacterium gastrosuis]MDD7391386.1 Na+/H+ antiporter NhaC family protein [Fusobacteriaceae bacterium]MDD7411525.1 Na+/H+ antiporter NhaC family protein [Fusobacteriaceae bacterium]MDY4011901.1 Na+/H+ antiporter NhaC family protein [Fusobacterium gastrosuis]MDY5305521.1 Na+/H+ antiporter NhaC family protein [Fusobacterium gastrosuis]MDY5712645.1 Na+/H+ antiporter NhaC family protein [Fusobacterium gastrosuis]